MNYNSGPYKLPSGVQSTDGGLVSMGQVMEEIHMKYCGVRMHHISRFYSFMKDEILQYYHSKKGHLTTKIIQF